MNYIDIIFILFVAVFTFVGYRKGLIRESMDVLVFGLSFLAAITVGPILSGALLKFLDIPESYMRAGSFFAIWFIFQLILFLVERYLARRIDDDVLNTPWNIWGGSVLGFVKAVFVGFFVVVLMMIPPISTFANPVIGKSFVGTNLNNNADSIENFFKRMFGGVAASIGEFSTISSGSDEKIDLGFVVESPSVDKASANDMLRSVNAERKKEGFSELKLDSKLSKVAEAHGRDMFTKGYLSHRNMDGKTPFDRMREAGVTFFFAGENLAIAQSNDIAMEGLMQSPGHRANILSGNYGKIGIAVLDGGDKGKIFIQEFTD